MLLLVQKGEAPQKKLCNYIAEFQWSKLLAYFTATCRNHSPLHNCRALWTPANKQHTQLKVTMKAFKMQVTGRRKQEEKGLKVLISCSLGQPNRKQL